MCQFTFDIVYFKKNPNKLDFQSTEGSISNSGTRSHFKNFNMAAMVAIYYFAKLHKFFSNQHVLKMKFEEF